MRIILADDHVMIREGLRPFIERVAANVTLLEAGTLAEAMAHLESGPADLVILDIKMPGMNGFQGLIALKQAYPSQRVVILSAVAEREPVLETIRLGADGFIPKSLSGATMVSALQLVLSGERFIPAMLISRTPRSEEVIEVGSRSISGRLTPRERDILRLLREGLPNKVIASRLDVSEVTVKSHLGNVFRKLNVQNRLQAMRLMVDSEPF
jgi:two-component system, NarL family, nitrate/nitrite response regulator NarL